MIEGSFIEDKDVRQGGEDEVEDESEEPAAGVRSVPTRAGCSACVTHHVMRNSVTSCRRQSSRGNWLMHAYLPGVKERYSLAGRNCQVVGGSAVGISRTLEVALRAYAGCFAGRSVAHIASKAKVSKNSRKISIVTVAVAAGVSPPEGRMRGLGSRGRRGQRELVSMEKHKQVEVIIPKIKLQRLSSKRGTFFPLSQAS